MLRSLPLVNFSPSVSDFLSSSRLGVYLVFFSLVGLNEAIDIAMQRIVKALEDNDPKVRSSAVNALGECSKQR